MNNPQINQAFDCAFDAFSCINWAVTINDPAEMVAKIAETRRALNQLDALAKRECELLSVECQVIK